MKKNIISLTLALTWIFPASAQLTSGFYHIQNTATGRYISINDTDPGNYKIISSDVNMGGIRTYKNYDTVAVSPSCVIFIRELENGKYDMVGQGSSIYAMTGNRLPIDFTSNGDGSYKIHGTYSSIIKYLSDGSPSNNDSWLMNRREDTRNWKPIPINTTTEWIGIRPDVKTADGKYYGTIYAGFNFRFASDGMAAYYISNAGGTGYTLAQIGEDIIPAGTPVIVRCNSANPEDNKIEPIAGAWEFNEVNWLKGVYCACLETLHRNVTEYLPQTMRVIGLDDNGNLAFVKAEAKDLYGKKEDEHFYLRANKAYLQVGIDAADVLTNGGYNGISNVKAERNNDNALYTLTGVRLPEGSTPKGGIYVKNGKKVIIK